MIMIDFARKTISECSIILPQSRGTYTELQPKALLTTGMKELVLAENVLLDQVPSLKHRIYQIFSNRSEETIWFLMVRSAEAPELYASRKMSVSSIGSTKSKLVLPQKRPLLIFCADENWQSGGNLTVQPVMQLSGDSNLEIHIPEQARFTFSNSHIYFIYE